MRVLLCAVGVIVLLALPQSVRAQTWSPSVNQRMTPPTSQADGYVGVSLGQLIMALGLTLHGAPPQGLDDIRLIHPRQTAAAADAGPAPPIAAKGPTTTP
jgi:hypothetical protein